MASPFEARHQARQTAIDLPDVTDHQGSSLPLGCYRSSICTPSHSTWIWVPLYPSVRHSQVREAQWVPPLTRLCHFSKNILLLLPRKSRKKRNKKAVFEEQGSKMGVGEKEYFKMWFTTYVQWQNLPLRKQRRSSSATISRYFKSVHSVSSSQPAFLPMQINATRSSAESQGIQPWISNTCSHSRLSVIPHRHIAYH